jgi:hypothetical protein
MWKLGLSGAIPFLEYINEIFIAVQEQYMNGTPGWPKDTGTEDTISQFGWRNQMSSSNILSIHGLKKKHQFQDFNRDIQWWLCTSDNHVRCVFIS